MINSSSMAYRDGIYNGRCRLKYFNPYSFGTQNFNDFEAGYKQGHLKPRLNSALIFARLAKRHYRTI